MAAHVSTADSFALHAPSLADGFRVVAFRGQEAISEPYHHEVFALAAHKSSADAAGALGSAATLQMNAHDGSPAHLWRGMIDEVDVLEAFGAEALYRVVLRPRLMRLAREVHARIWVDKKVPEVVDELLAAASVSHELKLGSYQPVEHIGQYHESDLDFVSRRLEREGIHYYFDQQGDEEKLIVSDGAAHDKALADPVRYVPLASDGMESMTGAAIYRFGARHGTAVTKVALADYDYLKPALRIEGEKAVAGGHQGEVAVFGTALRTPAEAKSLAAVRAEERAVPLAVYLGAGSVAGLRSGWELELVEHPLASLDGGYLVTRLRHYGVDQARLGGYGRLIDPRGAWLGRGTRDPYRVEFEAVKRGVPFRPARRAPWKRIAKLEHARVDGPDTSDYAQIDEHGRYHVKLLWDETKAKPGGASAWIRMLQPHAGSPEGWHFPLRKDTEVLVAFLRGDPDRPVIVGTAHNPQVPSPVTSANATLNVLQTGGKNRLEIEDKDGSQYLAWTSPTKTSTLHLGAKSGPYQEGHDATLRSDGDHKVHAGGARHITVGGEETEDVQGNVTEDYHATQTTKVDGDWKETIDAGATQTISAGETRTVNAGVTETISGGETRTITGDHTEAVTASVTCHVGASKTETISADATTTIGANASLTVGGALSTVVAAGITENIGANLTVLAAGGVTFTAPGGFRVMAPGGVTMVDDGNEHFGFREPTRYALGVTVLICKLEFIGIYNQINGFCLERMGAKFPAFSSEHEKWACKREVIGGFLKPTGLATSLLALRKLG